MRNKSNFYVYYLLLTIGLAFTACGTPPKFEENVNLHGDQWLKDSVVHIAVPITDSTEIYSLVLNLRNNNDYPYRNIYLFIEATSPTGLVMTDTVQYELADAQGQWLGKRGNFWVDHRLRYRSQVMFTDTGNYDFCIRHGMRADTLQGIGAVGLRLELNDSEE
jgi:gliding motility-associated lipoprotein GldH